MIMGCLLPTVSTSAWAVPSAPGDPDAARTSEATSKPEEEDSQRVSLTLSPLHLVLPIVEITGEYRVARGFGAALIAGVGQVSVDVPETTSTAAHETEVGAYELGAQGAWYPLRPFESLQLGLEIAYVYVDARDITADISGSGEGLAVGPFVGYKLMLDVGFTGFVQIGGEYVTARSSAHDSGGQSAEASDSKWIPLLNLNLGWSF
jgi:hypothetical protein